MSDKPIVKMKLVKSSNVRAIGLHEDSIFVSYGSDGSKAYKYTVLPMVHKSLLAEIYNNALASPSKGSFIYHNIKLNKMFKVDGPLQMYGSSAEYIFQEEL